MTPYQAQTPYVIALLTEADAIENAPYLIARRITYAGKSVGNSSHSNSGSGGSIGCGSNSRSDKLLEERLK